MRRLRSFLFLALLTLAAAGVAAETARRDDPTPDERDAPPRAVSLVEAERAFSALSVAEGMRTAFLDYLADDGILFQPAPVPGRKSWAARPNPAGTLVWEPAYVEVSGFGDLGLSTGPWEYRPPTGADAGVAHGQFVSIWRREADGPWKVAVDLGVNHAAPARGGLDNVELETREHPVPAPETRQRVGMSFGAAVFGRGGGLGVGLGGMRSPGDEAWHRRSHQVHRVMSAERALAFELRSRDPARGFPRLATADVRVLREGHEPAFGITPALELATPPVRGLEFRPYGQGVAGSFDLAYSYGLALRTPRGASRPDTSGYLHVWRREAGDEWRLSLDVESAFPRR